MTDLRRLSNADFAREARRRGLRITHEPTPLTPEEDRAIRLLVLAAELYQEGMVRCARSLCSEVRVTLWDADNELFKNDWLDSFATWCGVVCAEAMIQADGGGQWRLSGELIGREDD